MRSKTKKPVIIINLKTYQTGKKALQLAKTIESVCPEAIVGVQTVDITLIKNKTKLTVYAQHIDNGTPGRHTGYTLPEAVKEAGAKGTFLNHSEHPLAYETLRKTMLQCKKNKLKTAVFAKNLAEAKKIKKLQPDHLIIEPPQLVAGKVSITDAKPELIQKIAKELKREFLVGAGIKTQKDIEKALELGANGVAFASIVTKAKNPRKVLKELVR